MIGHFKHSARNRAATTSATGPSIPAHRRLRLTLAALAAVWISVLAPCVHAAPLRVDSFSPNAGGMGDIVTILGTGFGNNPDNLCAIVMNGDLAIPLEVIQATDTQLRVRLGPVAPNARPGPVGVALGQGGRGIFKPLFPDINVVEPAWVWVRTPQGPEALTPQPFTPVPTPINNRVKWFFSGPPTNGVICLFLDGNWPAPSKIRVQARAHDHQRGIGRDLDAFCITVPGGGTLMDCAARICDTIRCAFMQQGMVAVNCTATQVPGANQVKLTLTMPDGHIGWGNLNVCVETAQSPAPPVIAAVNPPFGCESNIVTLFGTGFGNNPDNICAVIMLPDQRSIPLEVLTAVSNRVTARIGAVPPDLAAGSVGQVMVALGDGQKGTFRPAFFDIFVELPVWVWNRTGPAATAPQPFQILPCPTPTKRCCFFSGPPTSDGKLCLYLDKPWPAYSRVRIEARAHDHQRGIGRDLRAICLRFGAPVPPGGVPDNTSGQENILRCAYRICDSIVCAFRQQANLEVSCTVQIDAASGRVKITLSLPDGFINWGNLNVCFEAIPTTAAPVITSVTPTTVQPGDILTIRGSGFGNNPDNLCVVLMDGGVSIPFQAIHATDGEIQAVVGEVHPAARPGPIMVGLGMGGFGRFRPAFFDVFVADDVWTWNRMGGAALSPVTIRPVPRPPPPQRQWFFSGQPTNGVICLFLSNAWPSSAKITIQARVHDHEREIGRDLAAYDLRFTGGGSLLECAYRICDSISCAFQQQAGIAVFCAVTQLTNGQVKITLGLPDGRVGWGNLNVCVSPGNPRPAPVITGVTPPQGGEGTVLTINGANFGNNPDDICAVVMTGNESVPLQVLEATDTRIRAVVGPVSPTGGSTVPSQVMIGLGDGGRGFFTPVLSNIVVREPVWTWNRNGGPAGMGGTFRPVPSQPSTSNAWFWSGPPTGGMLMVVLQGSWPSNATIRIEARAHDHAKGIGHDLRAINLVFAGGGTLQQCAAQLCDSVRCAFLQFGIVINCQIIQLSATQIKLVLTIPNGSINWGNFNICVSSPIPDPTPVITSVTPLQAREGDLVTIRGTNFPTDPNDVCMVHMGGPGSPVAMMSTPFEVLTSSRTQIVARLNVVNPAAQPGPIMIGSGHGTVGMPTFAFFDVFTELPVWTWERTGLAGQSPPSLAFRPIPTQPPPTTNWFFSGPPVNGVLCLYLDGNWPKPAKIEIHARAHDHQRRIGRDLRAICIRFDGGGNILDCAYRICDVLRCAFRQQGGFEISCTVELVTDAAGGQRVKLTLGLPEGHIDWGNFNVCVSPVPKPVPVITSVSPLIGRQGDIITVRGTNFPTDPNDVCMVVMGPPTLSTPFEVLTSSSTSITARLSAVDNDAKPGPIMIGVGHGRTGAFRPAFFDIFVEEPVWTWQRNGPAVMGQQIFTPQASGTPGATWFFSGPPSTDGKLSVTLNGNWTANTKITIEARAHDHQRGIGRDLRAICIRLPAGGTALDCAARICDVIRCAFAQQGIMVNCIVEPVPGGSVRLTLTLPDGVISWGNFNVCVRTPTINLPPVISTVVPQQAAEGDIVTITGSGFGNNPDNLCLVIMDGNNAIPLQGLTSVSNRITARLGPVPPDARPGVVMVGLGKGGRGRFRPAFFDVFLADDVWTWDRNGGAMATAPGTFRPIPRPPPPYTKWFFSGPPTNGVLCLYLRGNWPDPANIRIQARAHDHQQGIGHDLEAYSIQFGSYSLVGTGGLQVVKMDLLSCAYRICDSVACAFWQQAGIQVNCEVLLVDADTVKLVLSLPDGRIGWGNFNVCVAPVNGDPGPVLVPQLAVVAGAVNLNLCWPLTRTDFALEVVDRLDRPISWLPAAGQLHAEDNVLKMPIPPMKPHEFFRLRRPPPILNNAD